MKEEEDKTSFTTPFWVYCFVNMREGLRNACTMFNRMVKIVLGPQLRRNMSAYVDDVVIHNKEKDQHIEDLKETFTNLRKYCLMLNLEKCIFGVSRGSC
jgi:predicted Na+-dependent transporter